MKVAAPSMLDPLRDVHVRLECLDEMSKEFAWLRRHFQEAQVPLIMSGVPARDVVNATIEMRTIFLHIEALIRAYETAMQKRAEEKPPC